MTPTLFELGIFRSVGHHTRPREVLEPPPGQWQEPPARLLMSAAGEPDPAWHRRISCHSPSSHKPAY